MMNREPQKDSTNRVDCVHEPPTFWHSKQYNGFFVTVLPPWHFTPTVASHFRRKKLALSFRELKLSCRELALSYSEVALSCRGTYGPPCKTVTSG